MQVLQPWLWDLLALHMRMPALICMCLLLRFSARCHCVTCDFLASVQPFQSKPAAMKWNTFFLNINGCAMMICCSALSNVVVSDGDSQFLAGNRPFPADASHAVGPDNHRKRLHGDGVPEHGLSTESGDSRGSRSQGRRKARVSRLARVAYTKASSRIQMTSRCTELMDCAPYHIEIKQRTAARKVNRLYMVFWKRQERLNSGHG